MDRPRLIKIWRITKKVFFWIFVAHVCWFLFFIAKNYDEINFIVGNLARKLLLVGAGILVIGLVYYFFLRKKSWLHRVGVIVRETLFIGYIAAVFYLLWCTVFNPPITLTQAGSLLSGNGLSRDYISYDEMGPNIKLAVIASEDQLFPDHDGFDLRAIKLDVKYNKRHPGKQRGASTLSQQTAKNIFLWQHGGFFRKGLEVFFTFTIESLWSKRTILERYLNIAEMGRGVFGVQAAARKYFNKDAKDLSRAEAAQIAACLPNPKKFTVKPLSPFVQGRYDNIMRQMNNLAGDPDVQELIK